MYLDATFFVRLYIEEPGYESIRALVQHTEQLSSSIIGKMETEAALHRQLRDGKIDEVGFVEAYRQFADDSAHSLLQWLPLTEIVISRVHRAFSELPSDVFLRAGDAVHLATASEAGFKEIYSNDRYLLAAAPLFKLKGINPLAK